MKELKVKITGMRPLVLHNGLMADPTNPYTVAIKKITSKGSKKLTEHDYAERDRLEWEAGLYWSDEIGGIAIPSDNLERCILEGAKKNRLGKDFAAAVFVQEPEVKAEHRLAGSREFVQRFTPSRGVATEWLALARIRRQHRAHLIEQVRIVATEFAQALFARLAVQVDHGIEGCHCPFLAFHRRFVHAAVSFIRNARARRQSRRRVLSLIASMSATSTSV